MIIVFNDITRNNDVIGVNLKYIKIMEAVVFPKSMKINGVKIKEDIWAVGYFFSDNKCGTAYEKVKSKDAAERLIIKRAIKSLEVDNVSI